NLDPKDRLEKDRRAGSHAFLHANARGLLERHVRGVDRVVGTIRQVDRDIHDREAERAGLEIFADAGLHRRDILLGYDAAGDRVRELEPSASWQRLDLDDHIAKLAVPA